MLKLVTLLIITILIDNPIFAKENFSKINNFIEYEPRAVPATEFYDINDNIYILEDFSDNIIILHFWATWCMDSAQDLINLDHFQKTIKKLPIKIISISEDFKNKDNLKNFFKENKIKNIEFYIDKKNQLFKSLDIISIPTTILINKDNKEFARIAGRLNLSDKFIRDKIIDIN